MPGQRGKRGRGGYQAPATPAATSGPGALSRRTDGGPAKPQPVRALPGGKFGDRQATVQQQQAAPLASAPPPPAPVAGGGGQEPPVDPMAMVAQAAQNFTTAPLGPFDRPSEYPGEPLTEGLSSGPGAGPEVLGLPPAANPDDLDLQAFARYLPGLEAMANQPTASVATRNFVRRLRGAVPPGQGVPV